MDMVTIDHFTPWVGEECEVRSGPARLAMRLAAAEPIGGSPRPGGGFRLEFAGPPDPVLPQGIVEVRGPAGAVEMFVVPVGRGGDGICYEAIFN